MQASVIDEVRRTIAHQAQATGLVSQEQALAYGLLMGAFYETMASRAGLDPATMVRRYGLSIQAEDAQASGNAEQQADQVQREIEALRQRLQGTAGWLKAPNGKPSALDERLWLMVRTPSFKAWFGDWEGAPDRASKAIDSNGEPQIYFHGSPQAGFTVFDVDGQGSTQGSGAFFADNVRMAAGYSGNADDAPIYLAEQLLANPGLIDGLEIETGVLVQVNRRWVFYADLQSALADLQPEPQEQLQIKTGHRITTADGDGFEGETKEALEFLTQVRAQASGIYSVFLNVRDLTTIDWGDKNWDQGPTEPTWFIYDESGTLMESGFSEDEALGIIEGNPGFTMEVEDRVIYESTNDAARQVRAMGDDGVLLQSVWDTGPHGYAEDGNVMVVYDRANIKSIYNRGSFEPSDAHILHQGRAPAAPARMLSSLGFYSALQEALGSLPVAGLSAAGWQERIKSLLNKGLVKPDEVEASQISAWLRTLAPGQIVSRDRLLERLSRSLTTVAEVVLRNEQTRYGQYRTAGGDNYREVLLTLPLPSTGESLPEGYELAQDVSRLWSFKTEGVIGPLCRHRAQALYGAHQHASRRDADKRLPSPFKTAHWEQINVAVHFRLDDRTDAQGRRVLFVHEIQSDWGQEGRERGFDAPAKSVIGYQVLDASGSTQASFPSRDLAQAHIESMRTSRPVWSKVPIDVSGWSISEVEMRVQPEGPPAAPFVTKTDEWTALAVKRITLMAVAQGYDAVAFATGDQVVKTFGEGRHVNRIDYDAAAGHLAVHAIGAETQIYEQVGQGDLPKLIGKDAAARLLASPSQPSSPRYSLQADGLTVGGAGLRTYYDSIVPKVVRSVVRSLGGALSEVRFAAQPGTAVDLRQVRSLAIDYMQDRLTPEEVIEEIGISMTVQEVDELIGGIYEEGYRQRAVAQTFATFVAQRAGAQPECDHVGFEVTPELAARARQGMPLFGVAPVASAAPADMLYQAEHDMAGDAGQDSGEAVRVPDLPLKGLERGRIALTRDLARAPSVVALLRGADASTFLHEAGHFFLEVTAHLATQPDAPADLRQDMEAALHWMGVRDLSAWQAMDFEQRRPHHEQFARGFEAYLREGRAPAAGLAGIFERFGSWLRGIYRQAADLQVTLTDDMRGVYGRLVAIQERSEPWEHDDLDDSLDQDPALRTERPQCG